MKKKKEATIKIFKKLGIIFLSGVLLLFFVGDNPPKWIGILVIPVWIIGFSIIDKNDAHTHGFYSEKKEKQIAENNEIRLQGLMKEFCDAGYHISDKLFEISFNKERHIYELKHCGVLNIIRKHIDLYNRKTDRPATIQEIYERISQNQIEIMRLCSDETLSNLLKIKLESIPLNQVSKEDVRKWFINKVKHSPKCTSDSIAFEESCIITTYDIQEEARRQRKEVIIEMILLESGLEYPNNEVFNLPDKTYVCKIHQLADRIKNTRQRVLSEMNDLGHYISNDNLERIIFDANSPLNAQYIGTSADKLYDWICKIRTKEVCTSYKFPSLSKTDFREDFEKRFGIKLIEIPPPELPIWSDSIKAACAIQYYLKDEGIEADCGILTFSAEGFLFGVDQELLARFNEYKQVFSKFINTHESVSNAM